MIIEKKLNEITLGDLLGLLLTMAETDSKPKLAIQKRNTKPKPVNQYTLDGKYVNTYPSLSAAARAMCGKSTSETGIGRVCAGKQTQFHGFKWRFVVDDPDATKDSGTIAQKEVKPYPAAECKSPMQDRLKMQEHRRKPVYNGKPVNQYNSKGELVATYDSQTKAAKVIGCRQAEISQCCYGTRDSVNGFKFEFVK